MHHLQSLTEIIDSYEVFLFDAFGVLITSAGAVPGAGAILEGLQAKNKSYLVVTNDASKLPDTASKRYRSYGLPVETSQVISSGLVLEHYIRAGDLVGKKLVVFGTEESRELVRRGGAFSVAHGEEFDGVVFADDGDDDAEFLEMLDVVFSQYQRYVKKGRLAPIILANPDIIYPNGGDSFGIAIGGFAKCFSEALAARFPHISEFPWVRLGKPYRPIFDLALSRFPGKKTVFIGDTLETDIAGAQSVGLDTVLITSGVSGMPEKNLKLAPTYLLQGWEI